MNTSKLKSLVSLLDDNEIEVYSAASDFLINEGQSIIPFLEECLEEGYDYIFQERIDFIIKQINLNAIKNKLSDWVKNGGDDLLEGAFLIAYSQFNDIKLEQFKEIIDNICRDIWLELNSKLEITEKIRIFNHIIIDKYGYNGNKTDYLDPSNFYINKVLETHKGSPIILSIIYIIIAKQLSVPIYGVNLPGNFILTYLDEAKIEYYNKKEPKYYINPFNSGRIFKKDEIDNYLNQQKLEVKPEYYNPCSNITIIRQLISDLKFVYKRGIHSNDTNVDRLDILEEVLL